MLAHSQFSQPRVMFFRGVSSATVLYYTLTPISSTLSGCNLLSYSFSRSTKSAGANFSLTFKEGITTNEAGCLYPLLKLFDVVKIFESNSLTSPIPAFVGFIEQISIGANASNGSKTINISGCSIEGLLGRLTISFDTTAMTITGNQALANTLQEKLNATLAADNKQTIKKAILTAWDNFKNVASSMPAVSNGALMGMINTWINPVHSFVFDNDDEVQFPISANLYRNGPVNFLQYVRELLPDNIYEVFGTIGGGCNGCLYIRKFPFLKDNWSSTLTCGSIDSSVLTDYTFTRSAKDVYNVFFPYLQGSVNSCDYYQRLNADETGYSDVVDESSVAVFGYRPLTCNFVGFNAKSDKATAQEVEAAHNETKKQLMSLSADMKRAYSNFDKMTNGNATVAVVDNLRLNNPTAKINMKAYPKVGELLSFAGGTFYITSEAHSWSYGRGIRIQYALERGANYSGNNLISPLTSLSLAHIESKETSQ